MHHDCSYVVGVCLEGCDFLGGVVVVDSHLKVIATANDPILAGDEASRAHRNISQFEGLDDGLRFVGPDVYVAAVEGGENLGKSVPTLAISHKPGAYPWLRRVKVNALYSLAAGEQLPL